LKLFNKYLKRKIEKERKDNENLEETFQNIKKITGISNVKQIVERIGNKDKDYNNCVAKVNEKEIKISILKNQINSLNQDFIRLKSEASVDFNEIKRSPEKEIKYDAEELELVTKENQHKEELEELINKNTIVELTYERVMENIKFFIKTEKMQKNEEISNETARLEKSSNYENDILKLYIKFLGLLKESINNSFSKVI